MPKAKIVTRVCLGCGLEKTGPSRHVFKKYCSKECFHKNGAGNHLKNGKEIECDNCGKYFYVRNSRIEEGRRFCSLGCRDEYNEPFLPDCLVCGKMVNNPNSVHCSYRCSKLGDNNPRWKGGLPRRELGSKEGKEWRRKVFERDNYVCQICGERGGRLNAHHLNSYKDYPELATKIENGVTLCEEHHKEVHRIYGQSTTNKDWEEYVSKYKRERKNAKS